MTGYLTTHVLDTARGCPAEGVPVRLYRLDGTQRTLLAEGETNADGRTNSPLMPAETFRVGTYELLFSAGTYLQATGQAGDEPLFLDEIPIRFGMSEATHYHVPLLLSAYGFSTYRGS